MLNMKTDPKPLIEYLLGDSKNTSPKKYDDDTNDSEGCSHCSCWEDSGSCCDCGDDNPDWQAEDDD